MDWASIALIVITSAAGGGLVGYFTISATNRKAYAEADKTAAEAWAIFADGLTRRMAELEVKMAQKDSRIDDLEEEVDELRAHMESKGITPPPRRRPARGSA
jgi:hypothetical protein